MKIKVYNLSGEVVKEEEFNSGVFEMEIKPELIQQAVEAQLAGSRQVLAHAKGRSEVRGGGRKPWRQKGTGRARHGSTRSPLWTGGGVTFGPTKERNFSKSINKKAKKKALQMVIVDKAKHDHLILIDNLNLPEGKTKLLKESLDKLPVKGKTTLIALDKKNDNIIRAAGNLPKILTEGVSALNVVDLLKHEYLMMPTAGLNKILMTK
ncbi:MAG: 50S ribosomal protein L4 [Candidatus Komeilibacteria bacterium CG10_big_fil_rev_8_21_14_0_10_41_13]|uniref:Large ribosomal subunit protein uL4 n=1 Tax=Candidatus Komeilibacteria bacterium CG10_big_fil_rev_8_21_14_0_10_41_13 TaxID=1974476 RepID=A0A2M6WDD7_9BACT|nr:MAG: 50S ribosomal protein L4 [Candidatus Komeilibacteria bacterium CG10_big_fil_rev_8_21_14_0_10_41_13]